MIPNQDPNHQIGIVIKVAVAPPHGPVRAGGRSGGDAGLFAALLLLIKAND